MPPFKALACSLMKILRVLLTQQTIRQRFQNRQPISILNLSYNKNLPCPSLLETVIKDKISYLSLRSINIWSTKSLPTLIGDLQHHVQSYRLTQNRIRNSISRSWKTCNRQSISNWHNSILSSLQQKVWTSTNPCPIQTRLTLISQLSFKIKRIWSRNQSVNLA